MDEKVTLIIWEIISILIGYQLTISDGVTGYGQKEIPVTKQDSPRHYVGLLY